VNNEANINSAQNNNIENSRISRFEFKGTGTEYFGIWIVNILLTIVTLGIFSAWAKVRNKQYFYGNTFLEGSSFEYTAQPMQILKGRIIAVVFFVLYNIAASYAPTIGLALGLLLFVLAPWVIMKSLAFNARYSQYRNIRFGFHQSLKESAKVFVLIPMLTILPIIVLIGAFTAVMVSAMSAGIENGPPAWYIPAFMAVIALLFYAAYPYLIYRTKRYIADNHRYGNADFNLRLTGPKPFYKLYLKALLIFAIAIACIGGLSYALGLSDITKIVVPSTEVENPELENLDLESLDLENLDLENLDLENLDTEGYDLENFDLNNINLEDSDIEGEQPSINPEIPEAFYIIQLLSLAVYIFVFAYIAAHTYNIIYQNTLVGSHLLRAKMKPSELAMIYFTNTLGIIVTLGLFIPWAMVRTARYRVASTALQVNGNLDNFVAVQEEQQNVFGEEFGEVFDLDVGI